MPASCLVIPSFVLPTWPRCRDHRFGFSKPLLSLPLFGIDLRLELGHCHVPLTLGVSNQLCLIGLQACLQGLVHDEPFGHQSLTEFLPLNKFQPFDTDRPWLVAHVVQLTHGLQYPLFSGILLVFQRGPWR
jgi:hypothetical protein